MGVREPAHTGRGPSLMARCRRILQRETGTANIPLENGYVTISIIKPRSRMERQQLCLKNIQDKCLFVEGRIGKNHILLIQRGRKKIEWHSDTVSRSSKKYLGRDTLTLAGFEVFLDEHFFRG